MDDRCLGSPLSGLKESVGSGKTLLSKPLVAKFKKPDREIEEK
jgi:hypothetical protein